MRGDISSHPYFIPGCHALRLILILKIVFAHPINQLLDLAMGVGARRLDYSRITIIS